MKLITVKVTWLNGEVTYVYVTAGSQKDITNALSSCSSIAKVEVLR